MYKKIQNKEKIKCYEKKDVFSKVFWNIHVLMLKFQLVFLIVVCMCEYAFAMENSSNTDCATCKTEIAILEKKKTLVPILCTSQDEHAKMCTIIRHSLLVWQPFCQEHFL